MSAIYTEKGNSIFTNFFHEVPNTPEIFGKLVPTPALTRRNLYDMKRTVNVDCAGDCCCHQYAIL
jgi:hypothetical protein